MRNRHRRAIEQVSKAPRHFDSCTQALAATDPRALLPRPCISAARPCAPLLLPKLSLARRRHWQHTHMGNSCTSRRARPPAPAPARATSRSSRASGDSRSRPRPSSDSGVPSMVRARPGVGDRVAPAWSMEPGGLPKDSSQGLVDGARGRQQSLWDECLSYDVRRAAQMPRTARFCASSEQAQALDDRH